MNKILVTRSSIPPFEEYCEEIRKIWDNHWLTNMGIEHEELQKQLEDFLDCRHVVLYTNGHLALENAIAAMNFPIGAEVITTPFTFVSTTHAIVRNGLVPVFCDIKADDYTIDVDQIEKLVTKNTVAIIPVHVYGNICDVDRINEIAQKYHLKVIYDAAHAFAVKYNGISICNYGDVSMLSFHATKVYNTIEGGAACFQNDDLVTLLNDMKNFGIRDQEHICNIGGNAKMSEFQAAMGICNLRHISEEIAKRKAVVDQYRKNLQGIYGIYTQKPQKNVEANYAYFPVLFDNFRASRDKVFETLKTYGIMARKYFYPLTNNIECYANLPTARAGKTPVAAFISDRILTLPLYADLAIEDVDRICEIIISSRTWNNMTL